MKTAVTLIHKSAMPIAIHAVRTFSHCHSDTHRLEIHTDGSLDGSDHQTLLLAAGEMEAVIVTPSDRRISLERELARFPRTAALISKGGYFTKLELPMVVETPFFYFDSDIVWLRPSENLESVGKPNSFSTESWSWYFGIRHPASWVRERVPRRVNSGFYHISEGFPYERMESLLERDMFDSTIEGNSDQEIMAYLFKNMELYHPEDLKRSRVGVKYDFGKTTAAALHFPGRMWRAHMDQIEAFIPERSLPRKILRFEKAVPLSMLEILRMRFYRILADLKIARAPIRLYRRLREKMASTSR